MSRPPGGPLVQAILDHLAEHGPTTRADLCRALGHDRMAVASVVSRLNREGATVPKRIHVCGYIHEDDGQRRYPRALYALGDRPDKAKPKPDTAAVSRRYRERNKGQVTSVFDLARPGRGRRALVTSRPTGSTP